MQRRRKVLLSCSIGIFIFISLFAILTALRKAPGRPSGSSATATEANNELAFDLYPKISRNSGNLLFSPFSIDSGLIMTYCGTRGDSAVQMAEILHIAAGDTNILANFSALSKELERDGSLCGRLETANSAWVQLGFPVTASFTDMLHDSFGAAVNVLDFSGWPGALDPVKAAAARRRIDEWTIDKTHGMVKGLLPSGLPDADTRLILADVIYFNGVWKFPFNKEQTENSIFYVNGHHPVGVPMMHVRQKFRYNRGLDVQVLELPYRSGSLSMVIVLPRQRGGLDRVVSALGVKSIEQLLSRGDQNDVNVTLPKFKLKSSIDLKNTLTEMGLTHIFSKTNSDFSGITSTKPFFIQAFVHEACINVNEAGTEAAAGETISSDTISMPLEFIVDHPFLFLIRDNVTHAIVFIGRVSDPDAF